jgi:peptidoglycan hydrolase CwlO-like protein
MVIPAALFVFRVASDAQQDTASVQIPREKIPQLQSKIADLQKEISRRQTVYETLEQTLSLR